MAFPPAAAEDSSAQETPSGYFSPLAPARYVLLTAVTTSCWRAPDGRAYASAGRGPGSPAGRSRPIAEGHMTSVRELTPADAVTLDCTMESATQELASIDLAQADHTVTAMQYAGPATFLAVAARTVLVDPAAARSIAHWLDGAGSP